MVLWGWSNLFTTYISTFKFIKVFIGHVKYQIGYLGALRDIKNVAITLNLINLEGILKLMAKIWHFSEGGKSSIVPDY